MGYAVRAAGLLPVFAVLACGPTATSAPAAHTPRSRPPVPCTDPLTTNEPAQHAAEGDDVSLAYLAGKRIAKIEIAGIAPVPRSLVDGAILTQAGAKIDRATIQDDIRRLWRLEAFGDVRVVASKHRKGVLLRYELVSRPMIGRVFVAGATGKVRGWQRIRLLRGSIYDAARLHRAARDQENRYLRAGYLDADVRVTERAGRNGRIDVCFAALAGPKFQIASIDVRGNRAISDRAIRDALRGESDKVNVVGGVYDEAGLQRRLDWALSLYFEQGLVMAKVGPPKVAVDRSRGRIRIVLPVTEGPVYRIGKIEFQNAHGSRRAYRRGIAIKRGDVFKRSAVSGALTTLRKLAEHRGRKILVVPITAVDAKRRLIHLTFQFLDRDE